jgi:hypothetical protein
MNLLSLVGLRLDNIYQIRRKWYYSSGWNFFQSKQGLRSLSFFHSVCQSWSVQRTFRVQKLLLFLPLVFTRSGPEEKKIGSTNAGRGCKQRWIQIGFGPYGFGYPLFAWYGYCQILTDISNLNWKFGTYMYLFAYL